MIFSFLFDPAALSCPVSFHTSCRKRFIWPQRQPEYVTPRIAPLVSVTYKRPWWSFTRLGACLCSLIQRIHEGWSPSTAAKNNITLTPSYLHNRVSSCCCFNGPSAALRLIMGPVVGLGLDLQLQLTLVKLAGQKPVQGRSRRGPGGTYNRHQLLTLILKEEWVSEGEIKGSQRF